METEETTLLSPVSSKEAVRIMLGLVQTRGKLLESI